MSNFQSDEPDPKEYSYLVYIIRASLGLGLAGLICFSLFSFGGWNTPKPWSVFGIAILIAAASFGVGGVLGFLFGIPRSIQQESLTGSSKEDYKPNTNLEQISDWLTKILVGVLLTQVPGILTYIKSYSKFASRGLGERADSQIFALSILIYFLICGFFAVYIWARLRLLHMLGEADNPSPKAISIKTISKSLSDFLHNLNPGSEENLCALIDNEGDWRTLWSMIDQESKQCKIAAMYRHYGKRNGIVLAFGNDFILDNNDCVLNKNKGDDGPPSYDYSKDYSKDYPMNALVRPYGMVFTNDQIKLIDILTQLNQPDPKTQLNQPDPKAKEFKTQSIGAIFDEILKLENDKNRIIVSTGHKEKFTFKNKDLKHTLYDFRKVLANLLYPPLKEITAPINDSELKKGDILIVGDARDPFKPEEIDAVENFVSQGGSLFVIGNPKPGS